MEESILNIPNKSKSLLQVNLDTYPIEIQNFVKYVKSRLDVYKGMFKEFEYDILEDEVLNMIDLRLSCKVDNTNHTVFKTIPKNVINNLTDIIYYRSDIDENVQRLVKSVIEYYEEA